MAKFISRKPAFDTHLSTITAINCHFATFRKPILPVIAFQHCSSQLRQVSVYSSLLHSSFDSMIYYRASGNELFQWEHFQENLLPLRQDSGKHIGHHLQGMECIFKIIVHNLSSSKSHLHTYEVFISQRIVICRQVSVITFSDFQHIPPPHAFHSSFRHMEILWTETCTFRHTESSFCE